MLKYPAHVCIQSMKFSHIKKYLMLSVLINRKVGSNLRGVVFGYIEGSMQRREIT